MNKKEIIISVFCFIAIIFFYTFRTEIEIEKVESKYELVNEVFVSKKDNKIILNGFNEKIINLSKNEDNISFISEHKKYGVKKYNFSLKTDEFAYIDLEEGSDEKSIFKEKSVELISKDLEGNIKKINSKKLYKKSKNNEKALYINNDDELVSYNLVKNKKVTIPYEINELSIDSYNFSSKSGYISIYDNINQLSIFGADTGNMYGSKILGVNPNWISDHELVLFHKDSKNNDTKLGVYDVIKSDIKYFYSSTNKIYPKVYYTKGLINFFELDKNNKLYFVQYNQKKSEFKKLVLNNLLYKNIIDAEIDENKAVIVSKTNSNTNIRIIDLYNKNILKYNNISKIKDVFFKKIKDSIIINVDNRFLKVNFKKEEFLTENKEKLIDINLNFENLCILIFEKNDEYYLEMIKYN